MLRSFFNTPKNRSLSPPEALWVYFAQKNKILDPKQMLKKYTLAGVVASFAVFKMLLDLLVPYGFVLDPFGSDFGAMLNRFWKVFGLVFDARRQRPGGLRGAIK